MRIPEQNERGASCGKPERIAQAFDQIVQFGNYVAIGFGIASFFDRIDHAVLKEQWSQMLGVTKLPADHYAGGKRAD
jgi:hypothetical protein